MVLVVASSIGAAFSTTVSSLQTVIVSNRNANSLSQAVQVIMTQGLMYGFSSGLLFAPCLSFVDEWFLKRRGLANGILYDA